MHELTQAELVSGPRTHVEVAREGHRCRVKVFHAPAAAPWSTWHWLVMDFPTIARLQQRARSNADAFRISAIVLPRTRNVKA